MTPTPRGAHELRHRARIDLGKPCLIFKRSVQKCANALITVNKSPPQAMAHAIPRRIGAVDLQRLFQTGPENGIGQPAVEIKPVEAARVLPNLEEALVGWGSNRAH
jgi:hypothetical protein